MCVTAKPFNTYEPYITTCKKPIKISVLLNVFHCLAGCRTRWFNLDNPTRRGDYETVLRLQMLYPSQVCSQPVAIEAMTASGVPAHKTGDVFQL